MNFPILDLQQQVLTVNQHIEESGMAHADILAWLGHYGSVVEMDYEDYYCFESNLGFITVFYFDKQKISVITQTRR